MTRNFFFRFSLVRYDCVMNSFSLKRPAFSPKKKSYFKLKLACFEHEKTLTLFYKRKKKSDVNPFIILFKAAKSKLKIFLSSVI